MVTVAVPQGRPPARPDADVLHEPAALSEVWARTWTGFIERLGAGAGTRGRRRASTKPLGEPIFWSFQTMDSVTSFPALGADGAVYVGSFDKELYAFGTKL